MIGDIERYSSRDFYRITPTLYRTDCVAFLPQTIARCRGARDRMILKARGGLCVSLRHVRPQTLNDATIVPFADDCFVTENLQISGVVV